MSDASPSDAGEDAEPAPTTRTRQALIALLVTANVAVVLVALVWVWRRLHEPTPPKVAFSPPVEPPDVAAGRRRESRQTPRPSESPPPKDDRTRILAASEARPIDPLARRPDAPAATPAPAVKTDPEDALRANVTNLAIARIGVHLDILRAKKGAYPTSAVAENGRNRGIEALVVALRAASRADDLGELRLADTDGDGRDEIVDPWGRPLVYFSNDDYASTQEWGGFDGGTVTAAKSGPKGSYAARSRFQLWSVGPDGKDARGEADDLASWEIRGEPGR